ncbi:CopD family protein [Marinobacter sp.]|uniref:CopD family protein n=1 Tax=Marinobacter sp. TaxID=50741 RepID=UPI0034A38072
MNWLLILHISALLFWLGFLVYLPSLVTPRPALGRGSLSPTIERPRLARIIFTHAATPTALLAIIAGTLVFVVYDITSPWLIVKLTFVVLLVVNHILLGVLVVRAEAGREKRLAQWCLLSLLASFTLAVAVLWVVLAKPDFK